MKTTHAFLVLAFVSALLSGCGNRDEITLINQRIDTPDGRSHETSRGPDSNDCENAGALHVLTRTSLQRVC